MFITIYCSVNCFYVAVFFMLLCVYFIVLLSSVILYSLFVRFCGCRRLLTHNFKQEFSWIICTKQLGRILSARSEPCNNHCTLTQSLHNHTSTAHSHNHCTLIQSLHTYTSTTHSHKHCTLTQALHTHNRWTLTQSLHTHTSTAHTQALHTHTSTAHSHNRCTLTPSLHTHSCCKPTEGLKFKIETKINGRYPRYVVGGCSIGGLPAAGGRPVQPS